MPANRRGPGYTTITARFDTVCKRVGCGRPIRKGDLLRYGGPGRTYHLSAECAAPNTRDTEPPMSTEAAR